MINLTKNQIDQIRSEAEKAYPEECCGLLIGTGDSAANITISAIVPSPNLSANRKTDRFEIDPQIRINLERELRRSPTVPQGRIVGHYHSHPNHPAIPSKTDLEMNFEPELLWLIISVIKGESAELKAHLFNDNQSQFNEIELSIS